MTPLLVKVPKVLPNQKALASSPVTVPFALLVTNRTGALLSTAVLPVVLLIDELLISAL